MTTPTTAERIAEQMLANELWQDAPDQECALGYRNEAVRIISQELERERQQVREALRPFSQMADKFDVGGYSRWTDDTRLNGDNENELAAHAILYHNFLTLGDCRRAKAALAMLEPSREKALKKWEDYD